MPFELRNEVPMNLAQHLLRQPLPGFHVTGGVGAGCCKATLAIPLLNLADRLGTGAVFSQHLAQKRPEGHLVGVNAMPRSIRCARDEFRGNLFRHCKHTPPRLSR